MQFLINWFLIKKCSTPWFYTVTEQPISVKQNILQQTLLEDDCRGLPKLHFLLVQLFEILWKKNPEKGLLIFIKLPNSQFLQNKASYSKLCLKMNINYAPFPISPTFWNFAKKNFNIKILPGSNWNLHLIKNISHSGDLKFNLFA